MARRPISWRAAWAVAGIVVLVGVVGCAAGRASAPCLPGDGARVVVLVTATANEPRPSLTPRAVAELRTAADSKDATDKPGGRGSAAEVRTADGQVLRRVGLTPRRATCAVEHGQQRSALIERGVQQVTAVVHSAGATHPGMDLLKGTDDAVRGSSPGLLIVQTSGLSTDGGFDMRQVGWDADPADIVAQLRTHQMLPHLAGWRVLFVGVGDTAGEQQIPMTRPTRDKLTAYLRAIYEAAGAQVEFDDTRIDPIPPAATAVTPTIPIPGLFSATGPRGEVTLTLSDEVLGFSANSAVISPPAHVLLQEIAGRINTRLADHPDAVVTVRAFAADPTTSTSEDRKSLADVRGRTTVAALTADHVTHKIVFVGGTGTPPGETAIQNGVFVEAIARHMRRVEITY